MWTTVDKVAKYIHFYDHNDLKWSLISIPVQAQLAQKSLPELFWTSLLIKMKDPNDKAIVTALELELVLALPATGIRNYNDNVSLNKDIVNIINAIFYSVISITMFLCFFSLCASMASNLYEQKKEIAILRSMGVTKIRIKLLYFYEAVILVVSSCTLGVLIGVMVGYTMSLQQNLFLHMKMVYFFPW